MSIRPVDLQVVVHRTAEIGRVNENNPRQEANSQAFSDVVKKEIDLKDDQVKDLDKSEQEKITKDGKGNSGHGGRRGGKKKNEADDGEEMKDAPKQMGMFDVSV